MSRIASVIAAGLLAGSAILPNTAFADSTPTPWCLPGFEVLTHFMSMQGTQLLGMVNMDCVFAHDRAAPPATDPASGDITQQFGSGVAYWHKSTGYTVYTDGATHWAVCAPAKAPAVQLCSVTDTSDGYMWSTGELDPPADLPTLKQQAAQVAAQRRAEQFGGMSNDDIRQQIAELQAQADALSPQGQCGTFRLGDNYAAYMSCTQQVLVSTMPQTQQLRLQIAALQGELLQRSMGN